MERVARGTWERDDKVRKIVAVARGAESACSVVLGRRDSFKADPAFDLLILFFFFGLGGWWCLCWRWRSQLVLMTKYAEIRGRGRSSWVLLHHSS
jgi:hypothetical protein